MALTRRLRFGAPPKDALPSVNTVRLVPLTQGVKADTAWPLLPPGSAASMTNFLPLDGVLVPRSRLSSLNTLATLNSVSAMGECPRSGAGGPAIWVSSSLSHAILSDGSISVASFVSAFGLGSIPTDTQSSWQYVPVFASNINENMLVACGSSAATLLALYQAAGAATGVPQYSYLTSAPRAFALCSFDNYLVAWNIQADATTLYGARAQWCARGSPSNWTGEGSGFEDLLQARGVGTAAVDVGDGRFLLFTTLQTWYGVAATYPSQFQFYPLDQQVGCEFPRTVVRTEFGIVFLATDKHLRLIPRSGGESRIIAPGLAPYFRDNIARLGTTTVWATYDEMHQIYQLHISSGNRPGVTVNMVTGEWGYVFYGDNSNSPRCGTFWHNRGTATNAGVEGQLFGSATTAYSTHSLLATDSGSTVTATWQSSVIAADLPGTYKQLQNVNIDYRATSKSTVTLKISQDGGNNYEDTGRSLSLASAPYSGRASVDVYSGGAFPTIELTSTSTGFELHRIDVTLGLGGQR